MRSLSVRVGQEDGGKRGFNMVAGLANPFVYDSTQTRTATAYGILSWELPRLFVTGKEGNMGSAVYQEGLDREWNVSGVGHEHDLSIPESCEFVVSNLPGRVSLAVFAHAYHYPQLLSATTLELWEKVISTNLSSHFYLVRALINQEKLAPNALLVFFSSVQALAPSKGRALYAIMKQSAEALTRGLAVELAPNARTVCLRMGQLDKPMHGLTVDFDYVKTRAPLGIVHARDVARLIFQLYEQPAITGSIITVDGGHLLNIW